MLSHKPNMPEVMKKKNKSADVDKVLGADGAANIKQPSLVYVTHMTYPSPAAHAIQISRTVSALGCHAKVYLVVKKMKETVRDAERVYGLELRNRVEFVEFNQKFGLLGMVWLIWKIRRMIPGPFVFYTRSYSFADSLIRLRPWHRMKIFFESHKKMGYYKEDFVRNSGFDLVRDEQDATNEPITLIEKVYKGCDCVFFLHEHSREIAGRDLGLQRTVWNWYGIDNGRTESSKEPEYDFIYCGSVSKGKLLSLLLDAAARVEEPFSFHLYGRCDDATVKWLEHEIGRRNLVERISYMGVLSFAELQKRLSLYRFGIATMEGIKVIDYIENKLALVIPRNASNEEVFDEMDVCYYQSDDPSDLARVMSECLTSQVSRRVSAEMRSRFSLEERARKIHREMIVDVVKS